MYLIKLLFNDELLIYNSSLTERGKIRKIFSLNKYNTVEDLLKDYDVKKCGFCGNVCKIKSYKTKLENNNLYIFDIEYKKDTNICYRNYKDYTCKRKTLNPNSIEYVKVAFNLSDEDALKHIHLRNKSPFYSINFSSNDEYKKSQSRGKDYFNSEAEFKKYCDKISYKNSLQRYIDDYGDVKGKVKFEEIQLKKDNSSLEYFIKEFGEDEGKIKFDLKNNKTVNTLDNFILRYGEDEGTKKYLNKNKKCTQTIENSIRIYGEIEGTKKYYERIKNIKYKNSLQRYIDDFGIDKGNKIYNSITAKKMVKFGRASKESMNVLFLDIIKICEEYNLEYYVGYDDNKEYFIRDGQKIYFYDFTIKDLNLIVEYHNCFWHFNKDNILYNSILECSTEKLKQKDDIKRDVAIKNGFTIFEVFDIDNITDKLFEIKQFIKDKYDRRENVCNDV